MNRSFFSAQPARSVAFFAGISLSVGLRGTANKEGTAAVFVFQTRLSRASLLRCLRSSRVEGEGAWPLLQRREPFYSQRSLMKKQKASFAKRVVVGFGGGPCRLYTSTVECGNLLRFCFFPNSRAVSGCAALPSLQRRRIAESFFQVLESGPGAGSCAGEEGLGRMQSPSLKRRSIRKRRPLLRAFPLSRPAACVCRNDEFFGRSSGGRGRADGSHG